MLKIITFSGSAGAGKDTAARFIKEGLERKGLRVFEIAYADWVKAILTKNYGYHEGDKDKHRNLIQWFGTDLVRNKDPDFWVKIVMMTITLLKDEFDVFLLTDARFENELKPFILGQEHDVHNLLVRGCHSGHLTLEQAEHSSETLAGSEIGLFTSILTNNKSLDDLRVACDDYADYFFAWIKEREAL